MAYQFYVTVKGIKQGQLKGENTSGKITGLGFRFGGSVTLGTTGTSTGKREYTPVSFTKVWGAASPQLFAAFSTNEVLTSVLFEFLNAAGTGGAESVAYTITLTNAAITAVQQLSGNLNTLGTDDSELEEFSLTFQKIDIVDIASKSSFEDDWSAPV